MDSENDPALASWSTKFRFDTDQHRVDGLKKLQREIEPLLATVDKAAKGLYVSSDTASGLKLLLFCLTHLEVILGSAAVQVRQVVESRRQHPRRNTAYRDINNIDMNLNCLGNFRFQPPSCSTDCARQRTQGGPRVQGRGVQASGKVKVSLAPRLPSVRRCWFRTVVYLR